MNASKLSLFFMIACKVRQKQILVMIQKNKKTKNKTKQKQTKTTKHYSDCILSLTEFLTRYV